MFMINDKRVRIKTPVSTVADCALLRIITLAHKQLTALYSASRAHAL